MTHEPTTSAERAGWLRLAEVQTAGYARMLELNGGIGLLGIHHRDLFDGMVAWSEVTTNDRADIVLRLIADVERLRDERDYHHARADAFAEKLGRGVALRGGKAGNFWAEYHRTHCAAARAAAAAEAERDAARAEVERLTARTVTVEDAARAIDPEAWSSGITWDPASGMTPEGVRAERQRAATARAQALADAGMLNVAPDRGSRDRGASSPGRPMTRRRTAYDSWGNTQSPDRERETGGRP
ncbi:hypothetical protein [Occultella kanbiaonis]|uniref:hypothetical protein n=1 Tax=Occultella kanbiaonis TaxID=2675754 RepID=UPI0013D4B3BB|nr:hypothetical protein [Occultella kanbiaonis]